MSGQYRSDRYSERVLVNGGLLVVSLLLASWAWKRDKVSPLSISLWLWVGIAAVLLLNPLDLFQTSAKAATILGVGLLALVAPLLMRRPPDRCISEQGNRGVALARLLFTSAGVLVMVVIGVYAFRAGIAQATSTDLTNLSITDIRRAQGGSARGGGLLSLMSAMNPLLACLGVYGSRRYSRLWLMLIAVAVWASLQTPSRLTTLSLLVGTVVFYLYIRGYVPKRSGRSLKGLRRPPILVIGLAGAAGLTFFNELGTKLGKNGFIASYFPYFAWPDWTLSPILYFTGGIPALSQTISHGSNPQDPMGSIFAIVRVAAFADSTIHQPDVLGRFVPIPIPFNVYTGPGVAWFDFGMIGVVVLMSILGWFAVIAHRGACQGFVEWAWVSSVLAGLLFSLPQTYRLFFLDVDLQLVLGFVLFRLIRLSRKGATSDRDRLCDTVDADDVQGHPVPYVHAGIAEGSNTESRSRDRRPFR